jgi:hypothetical protein
MKPMSHTAARVSLDNRFLRWSFRRAERHDFLGITVALDQGSAEDRATCIRKIEAALRLIHEHDPRRLRRIQGDIDGIYLWGDTGPAGSFLSSIRLVTLRFTYVVSPSTSAAKIASTLVHEGTHARLHARGIDYAPERRARVEAICARSEIAFARRLLDPEDLIEEAEWRLALDRSHWSYQARQQRNLQALAELGVPRWFVALFERFLRLRDRIMRIWKGPPPDDH